MEMKHVMILIGFLSGLGLALGGLQHGWHDALTPQFVGGQLVELATLIGAIYMPAAGQKPDPLGTIDPRKLDVNNQVGV